MPEAYVAIGKNRQKIYPNSKIFMNNGQEFSIELSNPTQDTIAAKIYLNDKSISSSMIVIKPGERHFLERYIDSNNKFVYSTYEVGDTPEAKKAIERNGFIKVEFYREQQPPIIYNTTYITNPYPTPWGGTYPTWWSTTGGTFTTNGANGIVNTTGATSTGISGTVSSSSTTRGFAGASGPSGASSYTSGLGTMDFCCADNLSESSIETGRVEKGNNSDQSFNSYYGNFESWSFSTHEYQILPVSAKPVELKKIRQYCTSCSTRIRKSTWTFCPSCGCKVE